MTPSRLLPLPTLPHFPTLSQNYEALELVPGATKSEVKKAYRRLAMLW